MFDQGLWGRGWTGLVLGSVAALLVTACGIDADSVATSASAPPKVESGPLTPDDTQIDTPTTPSTTSAPAITEEGLQAVATDLQEFWAKTFPDVYGDRYEPVEEARIVAAVPDREIPSCDGERISYDDVAGNAFAANCSEGPLVVWDEEQLIADLDARFGPIAAAIVLAHEWGHIAQFQARVQDLPTVLTEQQADCFAGAWLVDTLDDPQALAGIVEAGALDASLSSIIEFRDAPGSSPDDPRAHGSGFDRVRALQEGFDRGAEFCALYAKNPPTLTEIPFSSQEEAATGGNLPLDELVDLVVTDLNVFYPRVVDGFRGATAEDVLKDENTVAQLESLSSQIGDGAAGLLLGMVWAGIAQREVGADEGRDEAGQLLQQACLSGGWLKTVLENDLKDPERQVRLSPGDLDESILALIELAKGEAGLQGSEDGVFELVADLRQGVIEGFDSCGLSR